jgi:hypothetical protein
LTVSGLAENTDSIFCDGPRGPETANGCPVLAKPCGYRMPASSTRYFAKRSLAAMPPTLTQALGPVVEQIAEMTIKIKQYELQIKKLTETENTQRLRRC